MKPKDILDHLESGNRTDEIIDSREMGKTHEEPFADTVGRMQEALVQRQAQMQRQSQMDNFRANQYQGYGQLVGNTSVAVMGTLFGSRF